MTAYILVQIVCVVVHYLPFAKLRDPNIPANCIDFNAVILVAALLISVTDVAVLSPPMPEL